MALHPRQLVLTDEKWREFFAGEFHQTLSLSLSEAFSQIFKYCIKENLVHDFRQETDKLSNLDSKDLSDTTNLIFFRFKTTITNSRDDLKVLSTTQLLNQALRSSNVYLSPGSVPLTKEMLQRARELETISNVLKLGRNLDAHIKSPIIQLGLTLQICSTILRFFEIFNFEMISAGKIERIRKESENLIIQTINLGNNELIKVQTTDYKFEPEQLVEEIEIGDESNENTNEEEYDEPIDVEISSIEITRQKLERLRPKIKKSLRSKKFEFSNKEIILSGTALRDILLVQPKTIEELSKLLSIEILMEKYPAIVKFQIESFGQEIVSNFQ